MAHILIIEDDIAFSELLQNFLGRHGYTTQATTRVKEGIEQLQSEAIDLVLLDYRLPDGTGMDVLAATHSKRPSLPVIVMTSFNDIRTAVQTIKSGARDYITKPVNPDELLMLMKEVLNKKEPQHKEVKPKLIEGTSDAARQINEYVQLVAPTNMSLIIQGESGTGKEQVARTIHTLSKRTRGAFVAIDCGALSAELAGSELFGHVKGAFTGALQDKTGQFVAANNGTLFLDEIGNLSYDIQVKLLRVLQEREIQPVGSNQKIKVDVRIIAATNDDLLASVRAGSFREDLYHRINEFSIHLPALRERNQDLELFISYFIDLANNELNKHITGLNAAVRELFYRYDWPGNLRELKNTMKRAVLLAKGTEISLEDLPAEMSQLPAQGSMLSVSDLKAIQAINEKQLIIKTLREVKYNKAKAARLLNIDRKTLYYKIAKYKIED